MNKNQAPTGAITDEELKQLSAAWRCYKNEQDDYLSLWLEEFGDGLLAEVTTLKAELEKVKEAYLNKTGSHYNDI